MISCRSFINSLVFMLSNTIYRYQRIAQGIELAQQADQPSLIKCSGKNRGWETWGFNFSVNINFPQPIRPILTKVSCNFDLVGNRLSKRKVRSVTFINSFLIHESMVTIHAKIVITLLRYSKGDLRITWIKAKKLHAYTGASNREELHSVCVFWA